MNETRRGLLYALTAYSIWGGFALFFYLMRHIPATEVLAHRILWSLLFVVLVLSLLGRWRAVREAFRDPGLLLRLLCSSLMIAGNWGLYIWAAGSGRIIEASLGYYITPLISILLGLLVLRETLDRYQQTGVALAVIGVGYSLIGFGSLPWISLTLAAMFGVYSLIRKQARIDNLSGLFLETLLVTPLAAGYLLWLGSSSNGHFLSGLNAPLLIASGVLTALPLLAFAAAAQRLSLTMLGFVTYLAPTLQLITAVLVLDEAFGPERQVTFAFIWAGLLVVSFGALRQRRKDAIRTA